MITTETIGDGGRDASSELMPLFTVQNGDQDPYERGPV